jgi:hypothetical protein
LRIGFRGDYLELRGTRKQGSGETFIMRILMICTPHPLFADDKIKKNEMGGTCSVAGEERGMYRGFGEET